MAIFSSSYLMHSLRFMKCIGMLDGGFDGCVGGSGVVYRGR